MACRRGELTLLRAQTSEPLILCIDTLCIIRAVILACAILQPDPNPNVRVIWLGASYGNMVGFHRMPKTRILRLWQGHIRIQHCRYDRFHGLRC